MITMLPLKKMTTAQKLRAMEELWSDLTRDEGKVESPAWHLEAVRATGQRVRSGQERLIPWEEAKKSLRRRAVMRIL